MIIGTSIYTWLFGNFMSLSGKGRKELVGEILIAWGSIWFLKYLKTFNNSQSFCMILYVSKLPINPTAINNTADKNLPI